MQAPKQALDRTQAMVLHRIAMRVSIRFVLILVGVSLLLGVLEFITVKPSESGTSDTTLNLFLLAMAALQFAGSYLLAKWLLLGLILRPAKDWRLRLMQDAAAPDFRPYVRRWFLCVVAGFLVCGALAAAAKSMLGMDPSGIAMGATIATFYGATYYILMRLIKSGDAVLEAIE